MSSRTDRAAGHPTVTSGALTLTGKVRNCTFMHCRQSGISDDAHECFFVEAKTAVIKVKPTCETPHPPDIMSLNSILVYKLQNTALESSAY